MHEITCKITYTVSGSPNLYHAVRAGFVNQGTTLNKWCISNGVKRQTAEKALRGDRRSRLSEYLLNQLLNDSGLLASDEAK